MHYDVYLQVGRDFRTHAHVPALPGCNWLAADPQSAMEMALNRISDHLNWLRRHGLPAPSLAEPIVPHLKQEKKSRAADGHMVGFFDCDLQPIKAEEAKLLLAILSCSRQDLLALTRELEQSKLDYIPDPGEWPIAQILRHVASAERWYLTRILDPRSLPTLKPSRTVWQRLESVRALAIDRLQNLTAEQRSALIIRDGEKWTARKVFRRFLEHEREHYHHILQVLSSL